MQKWRDRRPSDYDLPSTDDVLKKIKIRRDSGEAKTRHVIMKEDEVSIPEQKDRFHTAESSVQVFKVITVKIWILMILICIVLILQIYQITNTVNFANDTRNVLAETKATIERTVADVVSPLEIAMSDNNRQTINQINQLIKQVKRMETDIQDADKVAAPDSQDEENEEIGGENSTSSVRSRY